MADIILNNSVTIDFSKVTGEIKPMHGVGQPPFIGIDFSLSDYLKDAHIPYSRLHDVGGLFGGNLFVDIPNIFRDFNADVEDPESYDFAFTDMLISELVKRDIEPFFRLGVTIENYRTIRAYRIDPPSDNLKWAKICENIIRHYTEGWANGFNYKITYWEIWNEPDNYETPEENQMWNGTPEQYFELYKVASKYLKEKFPHLKIGGYASCGFYALTQSDNSFGACSPRFQNFITFYEDFLKFVKENNCPLDFFSWHSYAGIEDNVIWANYVRKTLDESGFTHTEHTLNEWNCQPDLKGTAKHAALTCGMMLALQKTSLDSAMIYDARCGMSTYAPLFNCMTYKPLPAYYSMMAFGELYQRKTEVFLDELPAGVYGGAAKASDGCIVLANTTDKNVDISLNVIGANEILCCKIIKDDAVWEDYKFDNQLPAESVVYIQIKI